MGDRAVIVLHSDNEESYGPTIYTHWSGNSVPEDIETLKQKMADRTDDVDYASARLVEIIAERFKGSNTSVGIWNTEGGNPCKWGKLRRDKYSHGDAGFFLVNAKTFEWTCHKGYHERG